MTRDQRGRPLRSVRISVTDRCNLRCEYCMPDSGYEWLPRGDLLSFEEIVHIVDALVRLGVRTVRLTGGEPLLRRDLASLVAALSSRQGIDEVALSSNGVLLTSHLAALVAAGLRRVNVSLDTLRPERFAALTRRGSLGDVLQGIAAAAARIPVKLNAVVMRGTNDDEIVALVEYARSVGAEMRFIEYMDVGGASRWAAARVVPMAQTLARLEERYGPVVPVSAHGSAPARRFLLADGTIVGIIASTTRPFCGDCDRARLTADGRWYQCLYAADGLDLRARLRRGDDTAALARAIEEGWRSRTDQGAHDRVELGTARRVIPVSPAAPHRQMHTRGG
jgi:GTP 3',8-cyclase